MPCKSVCSSEPVLTQYSLAELTAMRNAAEAIEDCAKRHGNVLANPAPLVLFEDFGDSAQVLTLYFWVELSDKVNGAQVASDLRFIIDKRLAEAGIVVAFPQRELRFDAARPVKVEVVGGMAAEPHVPDARSES